MPLKDTWVATDTFAASDANAVAAQVNANTADKVDDFDFRLDDNRTPIDGSVSAAKLDATLAGAVGNLQSPYFATTTTDVLNADSATNTTTKNTRFGVKHYTNAEEPFYGMRLASAATTNTLSLGGGSSAGNAATSIEFYTAANNTTTTGTLAFTIDSSGNLTQQGSGLVIVNNATLGADSAVGINSSTQTFFSLNSATASFRNIVFKTAGSSRWIIRADNAAESGSDAGCNFQIVSRTDAGSVKTTVIDIARATGVVTLGGLLSTLASATGTAGLRLPHGAAPTSPVNGDMWTTSAGLFVRINGTTKTVTLT